MRFIPPQYRLATAEESQNIDQQTINDLGIDGFTLMEVAGSKTADHLLKLHNPTDHGVFLCGKGNNAGDALVAARYLIQHNIHTTVVFIGGTEDLSPDCQKNFELLTRISEHKEHAGTLNIHPHWQHFKKNSATCDFIVDGMLGTGLSSPLRDDYQQAVKWANKCLSPVYAIDIPTGIHGNTGQIMGAAIKASQTFTYGIHKQGCYLEEGPDHCGEIVFCELPFPNYLKKESSTFLLDDYLLNQQPPPKPRHKYEAGVLYVVGGSKGLTGATVLAAQSAWNEGLGAVTIVTPEGNLPVYENLLPQIIKQSIGSASDHHFTSSHVNQVLKTVKKKEGTVLIGPGLGRDAETVQFVLQFLNQFKGKAVIDADALWALGQAKSWEKPAQSNWVLTPHPGELSKLDNIEITTGSERMAFIQKMAVEKKVTIVSKGWPVIVGTPNQHMYITTYDTRIFARAGFGDVLAGKISAQWALGHSMLESSAKGLLSGKQKGHKLLQENPNHHLEPKDLI